MQKHLVLGLLETSTTLHQRSWFWKVSYFAPGLTNWRTVRKGN
ncbi:hypothetical protein CIB84_010797 [Bambusicola thoracicus]|uniref:Uncharacterized protein n=1 Tax=Bambusicola thoracicus TaxID=9083 RepID=A0A2P4SMV5_BAMTH|nr:hypothetical protein CIB84_010797 [Bambusicola thoracicus]